MKTYITDSMKNISKSFKSNRYNGYAGCKWSHISQQFRNRSWELANILIFISGLLFLEFQVQAQRAAVVLNPDDKPAFAAAPEGFDIIRENISHGKIDSVEYISKTVGTKRKMLIYTPPGFLTDKKYPVLYLLHGIGGDHLEWYKNGSPQVILDNLYADKKIVPMIVSEQFLTRNTVRWLVSQ
jgi:Enterochelin esterase and related enzymes